METGGALDMTNTISSKVLSIFALALITAWVAAAEDSADSKYEEQLIEEIIIIGEGWKKPEVEPELKPEETWRLPEETKEKLKGRIEIGYDPIIEEMRRDRFAVDKAFRDSDRGPSIQPSTVFTVKF